MVRGRFTAFRSALLAAPRDRELPRGGERLLPRLPLADVHEQHAPGDRTGPGDQVAQPRAVADREVARDAAQARTDYRQARRREKPEAVLLASAELSPDRPENGDNDYRADHG